MIGPMDYLTAWVIVILGVAKLIEISWWMLKRMTRGWVIASFITVIAALVWGIVR